MKANVWHRSVFSLRWVRVQVFLWWIFGILSVYAQQIQLVDRQSGSPIPDVYYRYGDEQGVSDARGMIVLHYREGQDLYLRHLSYVDLQLDDAAVRQAFEDGRIVLEPRAYDLQPATVVQIRPRGESAYREEIDPAGQIMHDGGSFLSQLPGVYSVKRSASYGFDPVVRGFRDQRLTLVIDGVMTAHEACPNRMDPPSSQVALNTMDRVELIKGPYLMRYGMPLGGVIHFRSERPQFSPQLRPFGRMSLGYETNVQTLRSEVMAGVSAPSYDFRWYTAYARGRDYTDGEGNVVPADFNRLNIGSQASVQWGRHLMRGYVNFNQSKNVDFAGAPMDLIKDRTWLARLEHAYAFQKGSWKKWRTSVFATHVDHRMDNTLKPLEPRMMNAWVDAVTNTFGGRTEWERTLQGGYMYLGVDYKMEEAIGDRTREFLRGPMAGRTVVDGVWQHGRIHKGGVFAEWHRNQTIAGMPILWTLSMRVDYNTASALEPTERFLELYDDLRSTHVNTGISAGVQHALGRRLHLAFWLGRTQRSPSLTERFIHFLPISIDPYEMLGNPNLKPETNHQMDVLMKYRGWGWKGQLNVFGSYIRNYISSVIVPDLQPIMPVSPGVRQYVNIESALMYGFEGSVEQLRPIAGLRQRVDVHYTVGQNLQSEEPLPQIPPLEIRYRIRGQYFRGHFEPYLAVRYAASQERIATSFGERPTPSFTVIDMALQWNSDALGMWKLGVHNLLDAAYYEHLTRSVRSTQRPFYNPGRSFFVLWSKRF